ncbi:hypothetical protein TGME49_240060 [Toxoplasma gondii ME49]|uniref:Uncharacterized protein n=2 Tax=Toxoplasma gondii TaxID=5811 RepID=B6KFA4_TOXGV|nr:hypothetical protein TGME49_240060 [Toxoplasma gondii ME49]EPT30740.1 hypothetical protein TGME49_240060 [Toxoplasma gondii ME49]ESS31412.1 hypothetical protein TGVEG_240060 [Toxoplasma gondii VEG]CEL73359.1 TPA: hypothetical protein BN1205_091510 [Toxoplasma gondii VEG]|eukprot:XP_002366635.1 hypothetical protein TGME49_240060 [Toxoplasma gondii ME49]
MRWCAPGETIEKQNQMEVGEPPQISGREAGVLAGAPLGARDGFRSSTSSCCHALRFRRSGPYVFSCLAVGLIAISCAPESLCFEASLPFLLAGLAGSEAIADGGPLAVYARTVTASARGGTHWSQREALVTAPMQARRLAAEGGSESEDEQGVARPGETTATPSTPLPPRPSVLMELRSPSTPGGSEPASSAALQAGSLSPPQLIQSQRSPTGSSSPLLRTSMQESSERPGSPSTKPGSPSGHAKKSPPLPLQEQGRAVPSGEQPPPQPPPPHSPPRVATGREIRERVLRELELRRGSGGETSSRLRPPAKRPSEEARGFDRPGTTGTTGPQVRTALDVLREVTQAKQLKLTAESSSSATASPATETERRPSSPRPTPPPLPRPMSPIRTGKEIMEKVKKERALQRAQMERRHRTEGDATSSVQGQAPLIGPRPRPKSALQTFREVYAAMRSQQTARQVPSRHTSTPASQTHSQPYTSSHPSKTSSPSRASAGFLRGSQFLQEGHGGKGASTASLHSEPGAASMPGPSPKSEPPLLPTQHTEWPRERLPSSSDRGRRSPERGTRGPLGEPSRGIAKMLYAGAPTTVQSHPGSASLEVPAAFGKVEEGPRREPQPFAGMFPFATVAHTAAIGGETPAGMSGPDGNVVPHTALQRVSLSLPPRSTGTAPETPMPRERRPRKQAKPTRYSASYEPHHPSSPAPTPTVSGPLISASTGHSPPQTSSSASPPFPSRSSWQPTGQPLPQRLTLPGQSVLRQMAPVPPAPRGGGPPFPPQEEPLNLCTHARNLPRLPPASVIAHQLGASAAVSAPGVSPSVGSAPSASPPVRLPSPPSLHRRPPSSERRV